MPKNLIAKSSIIINAPAEKVWQAITDPALIKQYFFGVDTHTDWKVGSSIRHTGEWQGKPFEDKGIVTRFEPNEVLAHTHWSSMSGVPDAAQYYQLVTYTLEQRDGSTQVTLENDNNDNEESRDHSAANWSNVLKGLKDVVEKNV
jgi:uncharacterized protein YndB with AHSA1/START domain